ncbi:MAG: hypothetical protein ABII12_08655 [Planctomycetota bacterium]
MIRPGPTTRRTQLPRSPRVGTNAPRSRAAAGSTRPASAGAFTTVELLVSMAIMVVAIVAVSFVFEISSKTTGQTLSHSEVTEASSAVHHRIAEQLLRIKQGLLIIESPTPTLARADVKGAPKLFRLRHDRLVFIASGGPREFQSATDPTLGTPTNPEDAPASSSEALVYFGPGIPLADVPPFGEIDYTDNDIGLTASEWVLAHRAILLLLEDPNPADTWTPPDMTVFTGGGTGMLNGGPLPASYRTCEMDAVVSSASRLATGDTLVNLILAMDPATELLTANPSIAGLWEPNVAPTSASLDDPADLDYYTRSAFTFQPRLADFRIEWTDGVTNPGVPDFGTRWFGLRPDWNSSLSNPDQITQQPMRRQDFPCDAAEFDAFQNKIEWSSPGSGSAAQDAAYRAIWRLDTWQYRPKALRFTYRIYDARNRLKSVPETDLNDNSIPDPDEGGPGPALVTRFGKEFSIVVPIP